MASLFKRLFRRLPMARSTRAYAFALEHVSLPAQARVLDVGTGQGFGAAYLSRQVPQGRVFTFDIALQCLAWHRLETGPRPPTVVQATALFMPFATESMDAVFLVMTFHCLPEPQRVLAEVARVLRPGGTLVLADVDGRHWMARPFELVEHLFISPLTHAYTPDELREMLARAGLSNVRVVKRPGKEKGFMMWVLAQKT